MEMLLSEHATDEGRITRRVLDAFGDILEVAFQDGEVLDERLIGSLDELRVLKEERRDDMLVRRLRDDSGRIIRQVVDQVGRIVHLSVEEDGDSAESDERNGATSAARELAAREGIDLSIVGGTGPDGRVLARDVGEAVRRRSNGRFRESPERS